MTVPKLRFRADDGSEFPEWKEKTLGEITQKVVRKADDKSMADVRMISQGNGFILQSKKYSRENAGKSLKKYTLLKKNEFAYNHGASKVKPYGVCYRLIESDETRVPYVYHTFRLKNGNEDYWNYALNTSEMDKQLKKMVSSGVRMDGLLNINYETYMSVKVLIPSLPEQRKIADLLSAVDDAITAQKAEVAAWEKRKKGVMQKLFSQEVRFKADDGSDFPDWESTTVGELFTFVTEKNESGRISDVITNSAEHGLIPQREYFDKDIAVEGNTEGYTVIHKGDFVYNPRKSTIAPFGPFNVYERDEVGIVSPLYTCLTPRDGETAPYLSWYFKTSRWHCYIVTHGAQGGARHDRVGMTNALMKGIPVMLPSLPEQRKIADCLTSLDDVIAKAKDELDAWCELKKGLLQQMFV